MFSSLSKTLFSRRGVITLTRMTNVSGNILPSAAVTVAARQQIAFLSTSRSSGRGRKVSRPRKTSDDGEGSDGANSLSVPPPSPVPLDPADAWTEVRDKNTNMIYWWNTVTNETTALGAPRPIGPTALAQPMPQQQQGGMLSGLGGVLAQGMAFGAGSSIAHNVIGNMFGGSSHSSHEDGGGDSGDSWDV